MTTDPPAPDERRKATRFPVSGSEINVNLTGPFTPKGSRVDVKVKRGFLGRKSTFLKGEVLDVSRLGLRFQSEEKIESGARLKVSVSFAGIKDVIECQATVMWCSPAGSRPGFAIGIEFAPLSEEQKEIIANARRKSL